MPLPPEIDGGVHRVIDFGYIQFLQPFRPGAAAQVVGIDQEVRPVNHGVEKTGQGKAVLVGRDYHLMALAGESRVKIFTAQT